MPFIYELSIPSIVLQFLAGIGALTGLFYLVQNAKRIFERDRGGFSFGVGREINKLTPKERLILINLADESYARSLHGRKNIGPSLVSFLLNVFKLKGIALLATGALIAYSFPGASNLFILSGALFALIVPYLVFVTYNFFCSYMDHYTYRSEFIKKYLTDKERQEILAEEIRQPIEVPRILLPIINLWNSFSLRFPVTAGIIVFALARAQMVLLGVIVSSAVLPFLSPALGSFSPFEAAAYLFYNIGWQQGVELSFRSMSLFNEWQLPYTIADFIRLCIIVYGLRIPLLLRQIRENKFIYAPIVIMSWLLSPFPPSTDKDSVGFWTQFFYLCIIGAEISAVLKGPELLIQHPQLNIIGRPLNNIAQSLEGQYGAIAWGNFILKDMTQITGIDFAQQLHNRLGGKEDVNIWSKRYLLYTAVKFDPLSVNRMEINANDMKFLFEGLKVNEKDTGYFARYFNERSNFVRKVSISLLGERGFDGFEDVLLQSLNSQDTYERKIAIASLGKVGNYKAAELLMKDLQAGKTDSAEVREAVMGVTDPQAIDIFIHGLESKVESVRAVSALWLGRSGDLRATQPLIKALGRESKYGYSYPYYFEFQEEDYLDMPAGYAEIIALAQINDPDSVTSLIKMVNTPKLFFKVDSPIRLQNPRVSMPDLRISTLKKGFSAAIPISPENEWQKGGSPAPILTLGLLEDPRAVKPLTGLLKYNSDPQVRRAAAFALRNFNTPEVKDTLRSALKYDMDIDVKVNAASSLASLGGAIPQENIIELIPLVENIYPDVLPGTRIAAASVLGDIKDSKAMPALTGILNGPPTNPELKETAIYSLGKIADARAIPYLKNELYNSDTKIQQAAIISLGEFKSLEAADSLKAFLEEPKSEYDLKTYSLVIVSLKKAEPLKVERFLINTLPKNNHIEFQQAAILELKDSTLPEVIPVLLENLENPQPQIRFSAAVALENKIDFPEVKDAFVEHVKFDDDSFVRQQTALGLRGVDDVKVTNALRRALKDPYPAVRQASATFFSRYDNPEIVDYLKPLLTDDYWQVRAAATDSLGAFKSEDAVSLLLPRLTDDKLDVRQASLLPLAGNLKAYPELKEPLMNVLKDKAEDAWMRSVAAASLQNAGYVTGPDLQGINPLEKSIAVFVPGVDDYLGFNLLTSRTETGWSRNEKLGQDFYQLEAMGAAEVSEFAWSGNLQDTRIYPLAQADFKNYAKNAIKEADKFGARNIVFVLHSEGNNVAFDGIETIKEEAKAKNINIKIISIGSPSFWGTKNYKTWEIEMDSNVRFENFWDIADPISWLSLPFLSPNSHMVLENKIHSGYFSNLEVRQAALSMATGVDISITSTRRGFGSYSDPFSSLSFVTQEKITSFSSGTRTIGRTTYINYKTYPGIGNQFPSRSNIPNIPAAPNMPIAPNVPIVPVAPNRRFP